MSILFGNDVPPVAGVPMTSYFLVALKSKLLLTIPSSYSA